MPPQAFDAPGVVLATKQVARQVYNILVRQDRGATTQPLCLVFKQMKMQILDYINSTRKKRREQAFKGEDRVVGLVRSVIYDHSRRISRCDFM